MMPSENATKHPELGQTLALLNASPSSRISQKNQPTIELAPGPGIQGSDEEHLM